MVVALGPPAGVAVAVVGTVGEEGVVVDVVLVVVDVVMVVDVFVVIFVGFPVVAGGGHLLQVR